MKQCKIKSNILCRCEFTVFESATVQYNPTIKNMDQLREKERALHGMETYAATAIAACSNAHCSYFVFPMNFHVLIFIKNLNCNGMNKCSSLAFVDYSSIRKVRVCSKMRETMANLRKKSNETNTICFESKVISVC